MNISENSKNYNSVTILIEIHAKDGQEEVARKVFTTTIATTEKPGLLSYEIFEDSSDKGTLYSIQEWENVEAFQAHMSAAKSGLKEATEMLRDMPRISILNQIGRSAL
ncbi:antibiotic biosynthesis monooxygenase [Clostridium chromiireducens]|uniref:Antibiotic biosynthesis monooxygenase n=1 Tax=Clostridium chromiireducens TaxID=225345 RepID=A0A399INR3_9CLOT|nr:antibiotic biosynthesis monooxygenase [Clostridium chromiireducens]RII34217.1 antibiotic biosynthesis monooxygenase [Clostridium chromiireducens]